MLRVCADPNNLPFSNEALQGFEKSLVSTGVPREESSRQLGVVKRLISIRGDWWPLMFDRIYASDRPNFSQNPSTVLVEAIESAKPGRALDVAMGGSTNTVLHVLALAREAEVEYPLARFNEVAERTPHLAKVSPAWDGARQWHMQDVHAAGGIPAMRAT